MRTGNELSAEPDSPDVPASPKESGRPESLLRSHCSRSYVTLNFDADPGRPFHLHARKAQEDPKRRISENLNKDDLSTRSVESPKGKPVRMDDLYVRRYHCCYSAYARHSDGRIDQVMEEKLAKVKYQHFRDAFVRVSLLMPTGVVALAINAGIEAHYWRLGILLVGCCPCYLFYSLFSLRQEKLYLNMSGTTTEVILVGLLCVHSALIIIAEWVRPELDYGMMVMHIGFVHNFTPLSAGAMQVVTVAFGLIPYSVLRVLRFYLNRASGEDQESYLCFNTNPDETLTWGILTPLVILLYQMFVTMRRDESLRLDALTGENLRRQQRLLAEEEHKNQGMLMSMLPRQLIESLKANEHIEPQFFADVTVIFVEICHFSRLCSQLQPGALVEVLNIIYHEFDRLSDLLSVYKVETVGQVYMAVVGAPETIANHADVAAHFGLAAQESMRLLQRQLQTIILAPPAAETTVGGVQTATSGAAGNVSIEQGLPTDLPSVDCVQVRVGLNSGQIRAGVVGIDSPRYKLFGDTVNTASRMESTCEPGKVQVSPTTKQRLTESIFELEDRGKIQVKGKGKMQTHYLIGYVSDEGGKEPRRILIERNSHSREVPNNKDNEIAKTDSFVGGMGLTSSNTSANNHPILPGTVAHEKTATETSDDSAMQHGARGADAPPTDEKQAADEVQGSTAQTLRHSASAHASERARDVVERGLERPACDKEVVNGNPNHPDFAAARDRSRPTAAKAEKNVNSEGSMTATVNFVTAALGREALSAMERAVSSSHSSIRSDQPTSRTGNCLRACCERLELLFLLVPQAQKTPEKLEALRRDRPTYLAQNLPKQLSNARNLTIILLLVLSLIAGVDFFLDHEERSWSVSEGQGKEFQFRVATLIRALGNHTAGLGYLLSLTSPALSRRLAQNLTICMLLVQGASMLLVSVFLYSSEPMMIAMVAMYGAYCLFYTVCTIAQRLLLSASIVVGYVVIQLISCDLSGIAGAAQNIGFLVVFELCMACGVYLQEHLTHVSHYEQRCAQQRLQRIKQAKSAGQQLLASLLPPHVIQLVRDGVSPIAEHYSNVTILFTDIKGFTDYSSRISPHKLFQVLNSMYSAFDEIISNWALHKVEIIGDAYFVSAGCPARTAFKDRPDLSEYAIASEYAMRAVEVALALQRTLPSVCDDASVQMRVGLHTGSVVAGVVGKKGPRYHLFGAAVGYAEQMESTGIPGRVQISDATHQMLEMGGHAYEFEERAIDVEGEDDQQRTWLVNKSNSKEAMAIQKKLMAARRSNLVQRYFNT